MALRVVVLAACMLLFGTINTITTKFQDMAVVGHDEEGKPLTFKHPAVQSAFMFFGESLCLLPFLLMEWRYPHTKQRVKRREELARRGAAFRSRRLLVFAIPAACDAVATTLLNLGLYYTFASTYQMLRGTLVLFAGFFTVLVLRRRLYIHHWLGMALITGGAALVGAASVLSKGSTPPPASPPPYFPPPSSPGNGSSTLAGGSSGLYDAYGGAVEGGGGLVAGVRRLLVAAVAGGEPGVDAASAPLFGDLCVVAAQAFTALQFILEEKFVAQYRVPTLLAVGLEGAWGCAICALALPLTGALLVGPPGHREPIDSAAQALREIASNGPLAGAVLVSVVSIAFFNFFGISVTKALSGAARATIDATRTLFIWLVAMALGWERFLPLQVVGFAVLFAGTSLYNELIRICLPKPEAEEEEESEGSGEGSESGYDSGSGSEEEIRAGGKGDEETGGLAEPLLQRKASGPKPLPAHVLPPGNAIAGALAPPPAAVPPAAAAARDGGAHGGAHHQHHHHAGAVRAPRREAGRNSSDSEYTMARSMRLGQSTLNPHGLDMDTDDAATESEGPGGYSPAALSYGSANTHGLLANPGNNIPEGDEDGELLGAMSGVDLDVLAAAGAGGQQGGAGGAVAGRGQGQGERGARGQGQYAAGGHSMALGPHGMLSGGSGSRGRAGGGGVR